VNGLPIQIGIRQLDVRPKATWIFNDAYYLVSSSQYKKYT